MNSFSKIETGSDEEEDRLSNLPEFILCHILSLLPTKLAAKTSILSKRWEYLFLSVPRIDIESSDRSCSNFYPNLLHFINRRLMLCRTTSITAFRLSLRDLPEASLVQLWLTALFFRNVEALDIRHHPRATGNARKCSLSKHLVWESLVVLKLDGVHIAFEMSESVFFPNLKVLKLKSVELKSQSETHRFSEECYPQLEDLRLEAVTFQKNRGYNPLLHISSSTLKKLATVFNDNSSSLEKIDADAPHLQHLELRIAGGAESEMEISMCNLESIVSIHFGQNLSGGKRFTKVFSKVNNVRKLDLSGYSAEGLVDCVHLPPFPNLINLKIGTSAEQSVWNVLQHSPNLETLKFEGLFGRVCPPQETVAPCFGRALGEICIGRFHGTEAEIEAVRYILQHGVVLQRLIIYYRSIDECEFSTFKKLLKLKRRSPDCEIELCMWRLG